MSWVIITSIILEIGALILFVWGILDDEEEVLGFSVALAIGTALIGFGMMGTCITISNKEVVVLPNEIAITKYTVFVKVDGVQLNSTEAKFVNAPQDSIRIKKTIGVNSYGGELTPSYELMVQED